MDQRTMKPLLVLAAVLAISLNLPAQFPPPVPLEKIQQATKRIEANLAQGPFKVEWDSLKEWFRNAKFGLYLALPIK